MNEYHKIQTIFKRDPETHALLIGEYSCPEFEYLKDNSWVYTEKVDGTNVRIMWDGVAKAIMLGGKTDKAQIQPCLIDWFNAVIKPNKELFAELFSTDAPVCLYGEGYGPKIQKGEKYRSDVSVVFFDIRIGPWWLRREDMTDLLERLDLEVIPVIGAGSLDYLIATVKGGYGSQWGNFPAEGIVARPAVELQARSGQRIITKLKHSDFLKLERSKG